jgi:hypothetical protein
MLAAGQPFAATAAAWHTLSAKLVAPRLATFEERCWGILQSDYDLLCFSRVSLGASSSFAIQGV